MLHGDVPDTGRHEMGEPSGAGFCICCIITACLPKKAASIRPQHNGNTSLHIQTPMETLLLSEGTGNVSLGIPHQPVQPSMVRTPLALLNTAKSDQTASAKQWYLDR